MTINYFKLLCWFIIRITNNFKKRYFLKKIVTSINDLNLIKLLVVGIIFLETK